MIPRSVFPKSQGNKRSGGRDSISLECISMEHAKQIVMKPIGVVRSSRAKVEDDHWDREQCFIELDEKRFEAESLLGIDSFSHVEVIFLMDRVEAAKIETGARHPRNYQEW